MTFKPKPIADLSQAHQGAIKDSMEKRRPLGQYRAQQMLKMERVEAYTPFQRKWKL